MTTMRLRNFVAATAVATLFAFTMAQAQSTQITPTPNQQTANSNASVGVFSSTGNQTIGGYGGAFGSGDAGATDPQKAVTGAATTGAGTSSQNTGTHRATSTANGTFSTVVTATGATGSVALNGLGEQGNYTALSLNPSNFSSGENNTTGFINSSGTAAAPITGSGAGLASGYTKVTADVGNNFAASTDKTSGISQGVSNITTTDPLAKLSTSSGVSGSGSVGAQSTVTNPNGAFSQAGNTGNGTYYATAPAGSLSGSIVSTGVNKATISSNGASASAVNSTMSLTKKP